MDDTMVLYLGTAYCEGSGTWRELGSDRLRPATAYYLLLCTIIRKTTNIEKVERDISHFISLLPAFRATRYGEGACDTA